MSSMNFHLDPTWRVYAKRRDTDIDVGILTDVFTAPSEARLRQDFDERFHDFELLCCELFDAVPVDFCHTKEWLRARVAHLLQNPVSANRKSRPAVPWECWNDQPVDTDAAMAAMRAMCEGQVAS